MDSVNSNSNENNNMVISLNNRSLSKLDTSKISNSNSENNNSVEKEIKSNNRFLNIPLPTKNGHGFQTHRKMREKNGDVVSPISVIHENVDSLENCNIFTKSSKLLKVTDSPTNSCTLSRSSYEKLPCTHDSTIDESSFNVSSISKVPRAKRESMSKLFTKWDLKISTEDNTTSDLITSPGLQKSLSTLSSSANLHTGTIGFSKSNNNNIVNRSNSTQKVLSSSKAMMKQFLRNPAMLKDTVASENIYKQAVNFGDRNMYYDSAPNEAIIDRNVNCSPSSAREGTDVSSQHTFPNNSLVPTLKKGFTCKTLTKKTNKNQKETVLNETYKGVECLFGISDNKNVSTGNVSESNNVCSSIITNDMIYSNAGIIKNENDFPTYSASNMIYYNTGNNNIINKDPYSAKIYSLFPGRSSQNIENSSDVSSYQSINRPTEEESNYTTNESNNQLSKSYNSSNDVGANNGIINGNAPIPIKSYMQHTNNSNSMGNPSLTSITKGSADHSSNSNNDQLIGKNRPSSDDSEMISLGGQGKFDNSKLKSIDETKYTNEKTSTQTIYDISPMDENYINNNSSISPEIINILKQKSNPKIQKATNSDKQEKNIMKSNSFSIGNMCNDESCSGKFETIIKRNLPSGNNKISFDCLYGNSSNTSNTAISTANNSTEKNNGYQQKVDNSIGRSEINNSTSENNNKSSLIISTFANNKSTEKDSKIEQSENIKKKIDFKKYIERARTYFENLRCTPCIVIWMISVFLLSLDIITMAIKKKYYKDYIEFSEFKDVIEKILTTHLFRKDILLFLRYLTFFGFFILVFNFVCYVFFYITISL